MPLYDAKCKLCGRVVQDIFATKPLDKIVQRCVCGSKSFEKIPPAPAVRFKGEDWATKKPAPDGE